MEVIGDGDVALPGATSGLSSKLRKSGIGSTSHNYILEGSATTRGISTDNRLKGWNSLKNRAVSGLSWGIGYRSLLGSSRH